MILHKILGYPLAPDRGQILKSQVGLTDSRRACTICFCKILPTSSFYFSVPCTNSCGAKRKCAG